MSSHPRGGSNLREPVLSSSGPESCQVLSIDPFCPLQVKTTGKPLVVQGEAKGGIRGYLLAMASSCLTAALSLCGTMAKGREAVIPAERRDYVWSLKFGDQLSPIGGWAACWSCIAACSHPEMTAPFSPGVNLPLPRPPVCLFLSPK